MDELKTTRIIALVTATAVACAIGWSLAAWRSKAQIQFARNHERLRIEALLAERLRVEIAVNRTHRLLSQTEDSIDQLSNQEEGRNSGLASRKASQQLDLVRARKKQLENQLSNALVEKRIVIEQTGLLMDSIREIHRRNAEWTNVLKMEIIGLNE